MKVDFNDNKLILHNEFDIFFKIQAFRKDYIAYIKQIQKPQDIENYNLISISELQKNNPQLGIVYTNKDFVIDDTV